MQILLQIGPELLSLGSLMLLFQNRDSWRRTRVQLRVRLVLGQLKLILLLFIGSHRRRRDDPRHLCICDAVIYWTQVRTRINHIL